MATTWLQKRGLSILERSLLYTNMETDHLELTYTLRDEAAILQAAKKWKRRTWYSSIAEAMLGRQ